MAKRSKTDKISTGDTVLDELVAQLNKLNKHQYAQVVSSATKSRSESSRAIVSRIVNDDIEENLSIIGYEITCSACHGSSFSKNGKRNGLQRYICRDCGHRFTTTSGTFVEKSNYMWDVWVKVTHDLINAIGIDRTIVSLQDDYGCKRIHRQTVWSMRMKVLYALYNIPSPKLRGTIQMDDTFFREGQKGSSELQNPLPKTANVERKPRYGVHPSLLGILGPEFASATCAVDNTGHCVIRSLSMGMPTEKQIRRFIEENMEDIAFMSTDDDKTYRKAIRSLSLPHYICPSTRLERLKEAGYVQLSKDEDTATVESESNRRICERLWKNGELDFIEGVEARTFKQRCQLVKTYGLTISGVNSLHARLDDFIKTSRHGVSTVYLPLYIAAFEYLENRRGDGKTSASLSDAAEILAEAVSTHAVFNGSVAEEWQLGGNAPDMASGRFVAKLMDETSAVRIATGNGHFKFNKTDGFRYISSRDLLLSLPVTTVKEIASSNRIAIGSKSKSALVREIMNLDNLEELIAKYAYRDASTRIDDEDKGATAHSVIAGKLTGEWDNRVVLHQTMPRMIFADAGETKSPAVFLIVKTTGTSYEQDEVIGITVIDEEGEILIDRRFRPQQKPNWYEKANNPSFIRPADTLSEDVLPFKDSIEEVEGILRSAKAVIGWNLHFHLDMLHACHVNVPIESKYIDLCDAMYSDARKRNHNRRNSFDRNAQSKFIDAVRGLGEEYDSASGLDDAVYLMRIWKVFNDEAV